MKNIYKKLLLIALVHIVSFCFFVLLLLNAETGNDVVRAMCFFLAEPICTIVVYPVFNWVIICLLLNIKRDNEENKILLPIALIFSIILLCIYIYCYSEFWLEEGFSFFVYKNYWENVLF